MRASRNAACQPPPCHTCAHRAWRSVHGFMVMACSAKGLRFGSAPDLRTGHVNRAGGCVAMPQTCDAARHGGQAE